MQERLDRVYGPGLHIERDTSAANASDKPCVATDFAARSVQLAFREWKEKRMQVLKSRSRVVRLPLDPEPHSANVGALPEIPGAKIGAADLNGGTHKMIQEAQDGDLGLA